MIIGQNHHCRQSRFTDHCETHRLSVRFSLQQHPTSKQVCDDNTRQCETECLWAEMLLYKGKVSGIQILHYEITITDAQ